MPEKKIYLGDSVYCEVEDGMFKLTTNNGFPDDPRNVIYLEPEVMRALAAYVRQFMGLGNDQERADGE